MTTDRLTSDDPILLHLTADSEGYAQAQPDGGCKAYFDKLANPPTWTCGFGSTGRDVTEHTCWTRAEAEARLLAGLETAMASLDAHKPEWRKLSLPRQRALADMAYNLGINRLLGFGKMWAALARGDYTDAKIEALDSLWARQVGRRAVRDATMLEIG